MNDWKLQEYCKRSHINKKYESCSWIRKINISRTFIISNFICELRTSYQYATANWNNFEKKITSPVYHLFGDGYKSSYYHGIAVLGEAGRIKEWNITASPGLCLHMYGQFSTKQRNRNCSAL